MKNKKGFTLVELLVVIALLGLLITISIPIGLKVSKQIKEKMLETKIETIEKGAIVWGQNNKRLLNQSCTINETVYNKCLRTTIDNLLTENVFKEDEKRDINGDGTKEKVLINPVTNEPLNNCNVNIYIKNKRVYAKYDKEDIDTTKCYY